MRWLPFARILKMSESPSFPLCQTAKTIQCPSGDQFGSVSRLGPTGCVNWRSPVPSGRIVKMAPRVPDAFRTRRNAMRPFLPGNVA